MSAVSTTRSHVFFAWSRNSIRLPPSGSPGTSVKAFVAAAPRIDSSKDKCPSVTAATILFTTAAMVRCH